MCHELAENSGLLNATCIYFHEFNEMTNEGNLPNILKQRQNSF